VYGEICTVAITRREMDAYIARMRKNTAPGVSGIRIDHVAALPEEMRELIALEISHCRILQEWDTQCEKKK